MSRKRIVGALLALLLICTCSMPAFAKEYTYTVRIYAGKQGTFSGEEVITYSGQKYGDRITFDLRNVTLSDSSKYYVKGIRESGRDNSGAQDTMSFLVTGDRDYVVAYGILSNAVAYRIDYVDQVGNELAPSDTYYGNVGDKPVVAFRYIEGYQPQAYNVTRTLAENAAQNVFSFVYTPVASAPAVTPPEGNPAQPPAGGETTPPGQTEAGQDQETPGGNPAGDQTGEQPGTNEPEEIDDQDVPLANPNNNGDGSVPADMTGQPQGSSFSVGWIIGIVCVAAAAVVIGLVIWQYTRRRKKN